MADPVSRGRRNRDRNRVPPPLATAQRIVEMAGNGKLLTDIVATMRVSALGFAIGCVCGILMQDMESGAPLNCAQICAASCPS